MPHRKGITPRKAAVSATSFRLINLGCLWNKVMLLQKQKSYLLERGSSTVFVQNEIIKDALSGTK